jgi:hypothetical protein
MTGGGGGFSLVLPALRGVSGAVCNLSGPRRFPILSSGNVFETGGWQMSIWTILFVILVIAWIGGFTVFHVTGGLIHLLLVFAVISLILHFVLGTRAA